ncbi:MAG: hypothetical protein M9962_03320 [Oligoflexia bacterium]|nr:hypothetical protein [Oligoflexia bacterium]
MVLLLFLLFTQDTQAFTDQELKLRKQAIHEIITAANDAVTIHSPCVGMKLFSEATLKYAPAKECKKAQQIYDLTLKIDKIYQDNCLSLIDLAEKTLRNSALCENLEEKDNNISGILFSISKLKQKIPDQVDKYEEELEQLYTNASDIKQLVDNDIGKGEFAKMECALPVLISLQYKTKLNGMLQMHYSIINTAFDDLCTLDRTELDEYQRYLREGEQAFSSRN